MGVWIGGVNLGCGLGVWIAGCGLGVWIGGCGLGWWIGVADHLLECVIRG